MSLSQKEITAAVSTAIREMRKICDSDTADPEEKKRAAIELADLIRLYKNHFYETDQ